MAARRNPSLARSSRRRQSASSDRTDARQNTVRPDEPAGRLEGRSTEAGFTLIEVLVGLAVFSIAALALLTASRESVRHAVALDARTGARIVAENRLIETLTDPSPAAPGTRRGVAELGGRHFGWQETVRPLEGFGTVQIEVTVAEENTKQVIASATGLREVAR